MATTPTFTLEKPEGLKLHPPSLGHVRARVDERRALLGGGYTVSDTDTPTSYDQMVTAVRDRRRLTHIPYTAPAYRSGQPPVRAGQAILGDIIEREASTLSQGARNLRVIPLDENLKKEQERASRMERWTRAAILGGPGNPSRLTTEAGEDWFRLGLEAALSDGRAIWELLPRPDRWSVEAGHPELDPEDRGEEGIKRFNEDKDRFLKLAAFPFTMSRVDSLSYHEWRSDQKVVEAIKIEQRAKRTVYPMYGLRETEGHVEYGEPYSAHEMSSFPAGNSEVVTYWKADPRPRIMEASWLRGGRSLVCDVVWVVEVDGQRVDGGYTIGPPWHPLPYFAFHGTDTSLPDPMMRSVSVAFRLLRICDAIDELINMKMIVARWASMPAWAKTTPEGGSMDLNSGAAGAAAASSPSASSTGFMGTFQLEMGKGYELYPGQKIEAITWPQHAITILESLKNDLTELANLLGLPPIMRGDIPSAGAAGYLAAQLIAQAKTALAPVLDNATTAVTDLLKWTWWQVEHRFEEGVPIWYNGDTKGNGATWHWLTPSVIDARYDLSLVLEPLLPVDKIQRNESSLNQVQARAISMRRHRETIEIDDPDEEEEQIHAEELLQSPLIKIPRMARAAVRMGYITPEEAMAFVAKELGLPPPQAAAAAGMVLGPDGQPITSGGPPGVALPTPTQSGVPGAGPDMLAVMSGVGSVPGLAMPNAPTPPNPGGVQIPGAPGVPTAQPNRMAQAI